ncbi:MAG: hypothetical protein ACNA7K_02810 [Acholeplasmataceae bacterium]
MKKRLAIAVSLAVFIIISLPVALVISSIRSQGIFIVLAILGLVYVAVYVFGGLAKLIVYFIYGAFTALFLTLLPDVYQLPFVFIGTLLFVLNPLANFESFLEKKLNDDDVLPIRLSIRGSYWPYFAYRREMKTYYHLPQQRKLITKRWYLYLRQITTILLLFAGIFIFILEISNIAIALDTLEPTLFLSFYTVFVLFLLTLLMYKKGFTSSFRALMIATFPTLIFVVFLTDLSFFTQSIIAGTIFLAGIVTTAVELKKYYYRVLYQSYNYYDVDFQKDVYANHLFETLVYNDSYIQTGTYKFKVSRDVFNKHLTAILVYLNYFKIIMVAYAFKKDTVEMVCHFHKKQKKRPDKLKTYLESTFKTTVDMYLFLDPFKKEYEESFFHRPDYIVSRALYLAHLAKELEIKSRVIVQMIAYFKSEADLSQFMKEHPVKRLPRYDEDDSITVKIEMPLINSDFIIESKIRELLLSLMTARGKFVRINVYS